MHASRLLKDAEGFPLRSDGIYTTVVLDDEGRAAVLYWARCGSYGHPLTLLDWDVEDLRPSSWDKIETTVMDWRVKCKTFYPHTVTAFVEGESLAQLAQLRGCMARPIPAHLTVTTAWSSLCQIAGHYRDTDEVKITLPALRKMKAREGGFAGLPRAMPGPRKDDPTTPAWLYGIVLGLDEASAKPPPPAKVKVVPT